MEAIKNYLETMFATLPNTPEVLKAKFELEQMMEDKYTELKNEGKTENEAIGTVIAEFGNLDELASDLGIDSYVSKPQRIMQNILSFDTAKEFLAAHSKHAFRIALGVLLCILCPCPVIVTSVIGSSASLGIVLMFVMISIAVGIFIYSGQPISRYKQLYHHSYILDYSTAEYVRAQQENYRTTHTLQLTVGVVLCILCVVPAIVLDELFPILDELTGAFVISFAAIGVFMIVMTSIKNSSFEKLLSLNSHGTIGGSYASDRNDHIPYENPVVNAIMSVYWSTVTCIYLIISFLTYNWHITWIIWPIASVIRALIDSIFPKRKDF